MKKLFTLALTFGMAAVALGQNEIQLPYHSNIGDASSGWKVFNIQERTPTFESGGAANFSATGEENGMIYNNIKDDDGNFCLPDDWLISPGISLKAGVEYRITFKVKSICMPDTSAYTGMLWNFSVGRGQTVEAMKAGRVLFDYDSKKNPDASVKYYGGGRSFVTVPVVFTPTEDGIYNFGFHLHALKYSYAGVPLYITGFDMKDNYSAYVPKCPQDWWNVNWKVADNRELQHRMVWRLDTLDVDGMKIPDNIKVKNVQIYRGDELAAILPGEATEWTDNESTGLTPGKHTYKARVELDNGSISDFTSGTVMAKWCGPIPLNTLPWTETMNAANVEFGKTYISVTGNKKNAAGSFRFYSNNLQWYPSSGKPEDCYLILPHFKVDKAGLYQLVGGLQLANSTSSAKEFEIHLVKGTPTTAEAFSDATRIGDWAMLKNSLLQNMYCAFEIAEPGTYTLAVHRVSDKAPSSSYTYFKSLKIEETSLTSTHVSDLSATLENNGATLRWTNPSLTNTGEPLQKISRIVVRRFNNLSDTVVAATITEDLVPGAQKSWFDAPEKPGLYNYQVIPYLEDKAPVQTPVNAMADYDWVGTKEQKLPYSLDLRTNVVHQRDVVPQQKLWTCEKIKTNAYQNFSLVTSGFSLTVNKSRENSARFISSPFNLQPGYYKVTVGVKGGYENIPFKVGVMKDGDSERTLIAEADFVTGAYSNTNHTLAPVTLKVEEGGMVNFVFAVDGTTFTSTTSAAFVVNYIDIVRVPVLPVAASGLKVTPDADGALKALVEWTNPVSTNMAGVDPVLTKAVVYRDGEAVHTVTEGLVPGQKSSWLDTTIPTAGIYTYKVEVYGEEGCAPDAPEVTSAWIGTAKDLPYIAEVYSDWNFPAGTAWSDKTGRLGYDNVEFDTDDWVISPRLNFEVGKYYRVAMTPWVGIGNDGMSFDVHFGTGVSPADMMLRIGSVVISDEQKESTALPSELFIRAVAQNQSESLRAPGIADFVSVPAGVGTIGLHVTTGGLAHLKDFRVEEVNDPLTGIETVACDERIYFDGTRIMFASVASEVRVADLSGKIVLLSGATENLDLSGLSKGIYIVTAVIDGRTIAIKIVK